MMNRLEKSIVMDLTNTEITTIDQQHIKIKSMGKKHDYIITLDNRGLGANCSCKDYEFNSYRHVNFMCKHLLLINRLIA